MSTLLPNFTVKFQTDNVTIGFDDGSNVIYVPKPGVVPIPVIAPKDLVVRRYRDPADHALKCELIWTHVSTAGSDPMVGPETFQIQRDDDGAGAGDFTTIAAPAERATTYMDLLNVSADAPYRYRVRAVARDGRLSEWSNIAEPTPWVENPDPKPEDGYTRVQAGFDFTAKKGKFLLEDGQYPMFDPESNLELKAVNFRKAIITVASGKQFLHRGATNVKLVGIRFTKGGKDKRLNDNAAVVMGDRWTVTDGEHDSALGVGLACDGAFIVVQRCEIHHNGSAGVGGKGDDTLIGGETLADGNFCHHNNLVVKDRDGATMGKFTRSNRIRIMFNRIEDGTCAGVWFDISNGPGEITGNVIRRIGLTDVDRPWTGVGIKIEINFPGWKILRNDIAGTASYCIDCNETFDVEIAFNLLEESPKSSDGGVLGVRNQRRSDTPSSPPNAWTLGNVDFHDNTFTKGYGTIVGSGSGDKNMKLSKYNIKVRNNTGEVRYQNIAA